GLLERNPNVTMAFVLGETACASLTKAKLESVADWKHNTEMMAFKMGMPAQAILGAANRLTGHVSFVKSTDDLIEGLASTLREPIALKEVIAAPEQRGAAFLERGLSEEQIRL